jgi:hypothetical protein
MPRQQGSNRRLPPVETRFKAGKSGNPKGRPRDKTTTEVIRDVLGERAPRKNGTSDIIYRELLVRKLLAMALQGNLKAAEILLDRDDPKQLNIRKEEVTQIQVAMGVALPPPDWKPPQIVADADGTGRLLEVHGGD